MQQVLLERVPCDEECHGDGEILLRVPDANYHGVEEERDGG